MTYRELRSRVRDLANGLLARGLAKGETVGLLARNGFFFVVGYLAVIRAGLVAAPIAVDVSPKAFEQIARAGAIRYVLSEARYGSVVTEGSLRSTITMCTDRPHPLATEQLSDLLGHPDAPLPAIDPEKDLAALIFTSGSTGKPKGVMVTHRNVESNSRDIVEYLGLTERDRVMAILPFYYCFGASLLHSHLLAGGSIVLNNQFVFPEMVLDDMAQKRCTNIAGVPSTYQVLLRRSSFKDRDFPDLRFFQQAGGKLPNPLIREIRSAFPNVSFYIMYGQTEATARLSFLPPERIEDKLGSIGRGLASTRLEVLKDDGTPVRAGSNQIGQIVASGPNITAGYINDPEESARFFRDGKLWTGDLATVDDDGFIFIRDRAREFIKPMGFRVSPLEIEEVLAELPEVVMAAVFGVPDDLAGEAVHALVVPIASAGLSEQALIRFCQQRLPAYKVPKRVRMVDALPTNEYGKIARAQLLDVFEKLQPEDNP